MLSGAGAGMRRFSSRRSFGAALVAVAMLLAAALAAAGLDNQLFWDDEANTAIYGRNLLRFHCLTAWDGTNLVGYSYGGALGEDLGRELRVPPLPAYVAAAGLFLFGGSTFKQLTLAGRIPFVVTGVLSIGLLAIWLRRHFGRRFPWYLPPLILALSPAYLLYIRNCRYYALGVMFTLLVWIFWAPGRSRGRRLYGSAGQLAAWLFRCLGASLAVVLLISTHYLNAAAVLVTLPLFLLDPRYRQPRQHVLLGVVYAAAAAYGVWILATANPFAASYQVDGDDLDRWRRVYTNAWWFVRDLGTHEFIPWVLVTAFVLPWLPLPLRRLRPLARRAWILVAAVLVYAVLAAVMTPADMGKGPTAEMRYVVPLIAVGSVLGGLALVILWRWYRPLAAGAFLLLVMTNTLHLGFLAERLDGTNGWWPPMLYRYVCETRGDFETGNEEAIRLLEQLPEGTTVRVWPIPMIYPAMFYVPKLCYCDQLDESKQIRAEAVYPSLPQPVPQYLVRQRAWPEVVLVAPRWLREALDDLQARAALDPESEARSYRVTKALRFHWRFMAKPEIPGHFFCYPQADWQRYPGMVVAVESHSPVANHPALMTDVTDAMALCRWGLALLEARDVKGAIAKIKQAVEVDPNCREAHFHLANLLRGEGEIEEAIEHFEAAIALDQDFAEAHLDLGAALEAIGKLDKARYHLEVARALRPRWAVVYFNLGNVLADEGAAEDAIRQFQTALKYEPNYPDAHVNLGVALYAQGKVDEAIEHYRVALRMMPNHVQAHANLAIALKAQAQALQAEGKASEAKELREEAVAQWGEALQRVPPKHALAAEIQQMLYEELREASQRKPPDHGLAEKIRQVLAKAAVPQIPERSPNQ
jgi:tetratricopeptide (TPR) repeat protein